MSNFDLASLAVFAATAQTRSAAPRNAGSLPLEEAREAINIGLTDPKGKLDVGKKFVTLKLGQRVVSLAPIGIKQTSLAVDPEQVSNVTAQLKAAIEAGAFDKEIVECQEAIQKGYDAAQARKKAAAEAPAAPEAATEEEAVEAVGGVVGLDLDALDAELKV